MRWITRVKLALGLSDPYRTQGTPEYRRVQEGLADPLIQNSAELLDTDLESMVIDGLKHPSNDLDFLAGALRLDPDLQCLYAQMLTDHESIRLCYDGQELQEAMRLYEGARLQADARFRSASATERNEYVWQAFVEALTGRGTHRLPVRTRIKPENARLALERLLKD